MNRPKVRTLEELRPYVRAGRYRVCSHAAKHATCEGFTEQDIVGAVLYGKELLRYTQDERLLALGYMHPSASVKIPLHVVPRVRQTPLGRRGHRLYPPRRAPGGLEGAPRPNAPPRPPRAESPGGRHK